MIQLADALLVIDVQNGVCYEDNKIFNYDELINNINKRIDQYKKENRKIIFIQHVDDILVENSTEWQIVPDLDTSKGDYFINKTHANSFHQTDLEEILTKENVNSIELCGAQTEYCVDSTVKFAHGLGYKGQMISGNSTTYTNQFMSAAETIQFYENIWDKRFLSLYRED